MLPALWVRPLLSSGGPAAQGHCLPRTHADEAAVQTLALAGIHKKLSETIGG